MIYGEYSNDKLQEVQLDLTHSKGHNPDYMADCYVKPCEPETKTFHWTVCHVDEVDLNIGYMCSDFFNAALRRHRMQLQLDVHVTNLLIYLRVYGDNEESRVQWPFEADVTINIVNTSFTSTRNVVAHHCKIQQPVNATFNRSQPFVFSTYDSVNGRLLTTFTVECVVNFA